MSEHKIKEPIAELRKNAGLSIDETATEFDVNRATVFRWEAGSPRIPLKRLADAERIFKVSRHQIRPDIFEAAQ